MEVNIDLKDEIDEIIRVQNGWCYPSVRPSLVQTVDPLLAPDWTATVQPSAATLLLSSVECSSLCEIVFPSHSNVTVTRFPFRLTVTWIPPRPTATTTRTPNANLPHSEKFMNLPVTSWALNLLLGSITIWGHIIHPKNLCLGIATYRGASEFLWSNTVSIVLK